MGRLVGWGLVLVGFLFGWCLRVALTRAQADLKTPAVE